MKRNDRILFIFLIGMSSLLTVQGQVNVPLIDQYNVVWTTQSKNSSESMPLGGGDIGCNVWVENGEILLYMQQSGAFDKNGEYLKMGRIRIKLDPNPFIDNVVFKQELKLKDGYIQITGDIPNQQKVIIKLWVEVKRPVVHIDLQAKQDIAANVTYESWRYKDVVILPDTSFKNDNGWRRSSIYDYHDYLHNVIKKADSIEPHKDYIVWYQNNASEYNAFMLQLDNEGLGYLKDKMWDPLAKLISGGVMKCNGFQYTGNSSGVYAGIPFQGWTFKSKGKSKAFNIEIAGLAEKSEDPVKWKGKLMSIVNKSTDLNQCWNENTIWWNQFWTDSYVVINPDSTENNIGWRIGRNSNLWRYAIGGNFYGKAPTKFNGGNITFDPVYDNSNYCYDPDFRLWGGWSYTAANQSLVYWPYLKNGDFEAMRPEFDIYKNALSNAELRTKAHFGHEGCSFAEQVQMSGLPVASQYGFEKDARKYALRPKDIPKGEAGTPWIIYFYHGQLEHAFMILEYYRFSGKDISEYIPFIVSCVKFYDQHYQMYHNLMNRYQMKDNPLDANGKIDIFPSTAGERYPAKNPAEVIAGLRAITQAMLDLPPSLLSSEQRLYFEGFKNRIPELPSKTIYRDGKELTVFTASENDKYNGEGFLHSVYPYNLIFYGTTDFEIAKNTLLNREGGLFPGGLGIYSARMNLVDMAKKSVSRQLENANYLRTKDSGMPAFDNNQPDNSNKSIRRFPTYWMSGDWGPDHNWGGRGVSNLQEMLLQTPGKQIILLPAWPADWDVSFKLHAPYDTTVEAVVRKGKVEQLIVNPEYRVKDVVIMGAK